MDGRLYGTLGAGLGEVGPVSAAGESDHDADWACEAGAVFAGLHLRERQRGCGCGGGFSSGRNVAGRQCFGERPERF